MVEGNPPVTKKKWEDIGIHRQLGSFFYNYIFLIIMALAALLFTTIIIPNYILPFPETTGFYGVVTAFWSLMFVILNNGTGEVVTRYVSEHAIDNPEKTLEYIRFFIWFQMFTGLFQVTGIAIFSLYFMPMNLEYIKWIFIIYSTVQFPGMLTIYSGCLQGFQRFDKSNRLSIYQSVIIQPLVLIACVIIFSRIGGMFPMYGELMGSLIGYAIGSYLDDFITFSISAYMFKSILKKIGYSLVDTLRPKVSWEVIKNALNFGTRMMVTGLLISFTNFIANLMVIAWVPHYGTVLGIYGIAKGVCDISLQQLPMTPMLSEAYNHGKYKLYQYGIQFQLKYFGLIPGFLMMEIVMLLPALLHSLIGGNYALAAFLIPMLMPVRFSALGCRFIDQLQVGADKPNLFIYTRIVEETTKSLTHLILLHPKLVPSLLPSHVELNFLGGVGAVVPMFFILYSYCDFFGIWAKNLFGTWLVDKYVLRPVGMRFKVPWWQMIGAVVIVFVLMIFVNGSLLNVFNIIKEFGDIYVYIAAGAYLLMMLFVMPIVIFFLYSLFGGWDDFGLKIFKDAMDISGPSKKFVYIVYKVSEWGHNHSPLKNRFPIPHEDAERELAELNKLKRETYERIRANLVEEKGNKK
ncbi:MAG: hypothetical protein ACFFCS_22955 [Candidatus Hodarchaeota archaeon]